MAHYVILGAGECGARAAFALREKGFLKRDNASWRRAASAL